MTWEQFVNLKDGDTVEDNDGVLGKVTSIGVEYEEVWVLWENEREVMWDNYKNIKVY
ncbi:hypothetical protein [Bacillus cereus]|uniref:hypothetical protein n=1 Tax=Bacillus cereus TaxID=1396 RepID=UPI001643E5CF|nr:hypothetical protein [Bacillus cereus]